MVNDREKNLLLKELEEKIKASLKEIERNKSRLKELMEEKQAIAGETGLHEEEMPESSTGLPLRPLPKDHLLEEYISQKKKQAPVRSGFFNPEESAWRSIEDNDDILSETLARLVAAQGKNDRAIKIYQKLMLKYPKKVVTLQPKLKN